MQKMGWFEVVGRHSRSTVMSPFDRAHTTYYSTLIGSMCLSCTVFEIKPVIRRHTHCASVHQAAKLVAALLKLQFNAPNSISVGAPLQTALGHWGSLQRSPDPLPGFLGSYF